MKVNGRKMDHEVQSKKMDHKNQWIKNGLQNNIERKWTIKVTGRKMDRER